MLSSPRFFLPVPHSRPKSPPPRSFTSSVPANGSLTLRLHKDLSRCPGAARRFSSKRSGDDMKFRLGPTLAFALAASAASSASAGDLPIIKTSEKNKVPACATPGRLMAYLKQRNPRLDPKFERIAVEYMRHGETLGLRWDYAFFQMIVETGSLTFTGDVKPTQNNFAGLGATGRGAPGESFKDVSSGARAHLEHVLMYTGERVENPVAERTRKVQEWGVLSNWRKTVKGPMGFAHLTQQWAPTSPGYARDIEAVGAAFYIGACKAADPRP